MPLDEKSVERLAQCAAPLIGLINAASEHMPLIVIEGFRNKEAQERAFAEGKTKLHWPMGNHNTFPSRAVDIAPVYFDAGKKQIDWGDYIAFGRLMGIVQVCAHVRGVKVRFGLDWDGDFRSAGRDPGENFLDAPHVELIG